MIRLSLEGLETMEQRLEWTVQETMKDIRKTDMWRSDVREVIQEDRGGDQWRADVVAAVQGRAEARCVGEREWTVLAAVAQ